MRQYEVIIPVRNGGETLVQSIESVLGCSNASQLLLTLSDNFSTDGAPWKKALEKFPTDAWRIIAPPQSLGRVEHWTWAFAQGQLPWVKPLMAGDLIEDAYWNWAGSATAKFPEAGMLFSHNWVNDPGKAHPDMSRVPAGGWESILYTKEDFMRDAVQCYNHIGALTRVLVRTEIMRRALPFQPDFPWTADWRFYKRVLQQAPAVRTSAPLVCLDRSISRLSTSWKGLRGSFREDWNFAAEQAALTKQPFLPAFFLRTKAVGERMGIVIGRRIIPRPVRGVLTTASGMHRNPES
jgi:hypothetical protein